MSEIGRILTDETLDPPVKALFVYNSNVAAVAPDQERVRARAGPRGSLHRGARALPDRHRRLRGHRAPGHDHPRALRHPQVLRPPLREPQPARDPPRGRGPAQHRAVPPPRGAHGARPSVSEGHRRGDGAAGLRLGPPAHEGDHPRASRARGLGASERPRPLRALRRGRLPDGVGEVRAALGGPGGGGARPGGQLRPSPRERR